VFQHNGNALLALEVQYSGGQWWWDPVTKQAVCAVLTLGRRAWSSCFRCHTCKSRWEV